MNHEKRDQMIRDTLDQCLSGIDSLPSQRQEILRKVRQKPAPEKPFRFRVPALAAALVILVCASALVFRGQPVFTNRPDPLHPVDLYTSRPAAVSLSEGAGTQAGSVQRIPQALLDNWSQLKVLEKDFTFIDPAAQSNDTVYIDGYYYDGETLILLTIENSSVAEYSPVDQKPAGALLQEYTRPEDLEKLSRRNPAVQAQWEESLRSKTPAGMSLKISQPGLDLLDADHHNIRFPEGASEVGYLNAAYREDGAHVTCIRYAEPLPESLRNRDTIDISLPVTAWNNDIWTDGEKVYIRAAIDTAPSASPKYCSARISRSRAEKKIYTGQGTFRGETLTVRAEAGKASFRLTFSGINEEDPVAHMILPDHTRLEILVQDNNGNNLWYMDDAAGVVVYADDETDKTYNSFSVPETLFLPENSGLAEFPSSLYLYLIETPDTDVSRDENAGPRKIEPGVKPVAVLIPEIQEYSELRDVNLFSEFEHRWGWPGKLADDVTMADDPSRGKGLTPYIHSYYYDGETLYVALASPTTTRIEEFDPAKMEHSRMKREEDMPDLEWSRSTDPGLEERWEQSLQSGTPMGLAVYGWSADPYLWDKVPEEANEADDNLSRSAWGTGYVSETGHNYDILFFIGQEPLPDRLRGADRFTATFRAIPEITYYYFDGEYVNTYYEDYEIDPYGNLEILDEAYDRSVYYSAPIVSRQADRRWYAGEATFEGQEIDIRGMVSKASARITLSPKEPQQADAGFFIPKDNRIILIVQDENGNRLFYDQIEGPADGSDPQWTFELPRTLPCDPKTGIEDFPSALRVYMEIYPVSVKQTGPAWELIESVFGTMTLPKISPDTEPLAVLTPAEP